MEVKNTGFKIFYTSQVKNRNSVRIIVEKNLKDKVVVVTTKGDRIMLLKLVVGVDIIIVISAYAPK